MKKKRKPTIEELERILNNDEEESMEILPNGEIRAVSKRSSKSKIQPPLTFRENLGGEYCIA